MEAHLKLITDYIYERKGVNIQVIAPRNQHENELMLYMSNIAKVWNSQK